MADGIMSSFGQKYSENFDPTMVGLSLLSTANNQDRAQNLGQALLMGRQARLDEAQARAAQAAAKRSEAIKMAEKGMYETDKGFGRRQVKQDPTGGSYMVDMSPEGQVSTQQLFAPPAKEPEQKENYSAVQAMNAEGKPVVYMVNKYNPQDYYELGGAIQKGGGAAGAGGSKAERQAAQTSIGAALEMGGLRDIIANKERMSQLSGPLDAITSRAEAFAGADTQRARDLATLRSGVSDQVLSEVSKLAPATETDVALILQMKAPSAAAGQGAWADWYNRRAKALKATLEKNAPELVQDPSINQWLEPISLNADKKPAKGGFVFVGAE